MNKYFFLWDVLLVGADETVLFTANVTYQPEIENFSQGVLGFSGGKLEILR